MESLATLIRGFHPPCSKSTSRSPDRRSSMRSAARRSPTTNSLSRSPGATWGQIRSKAQPNEFPLTVNGNSGPGCPTNGGHRRRHGSEPLRGSPQIEPADRDKLRAAVVQYERQKNDDACTAGNALTDTLRAAHHRRAVRQALVELGYLDITRRSIPQPLRVAKCARIT